jgi:hypothetical protein
MTLPILKIANCSHEAAKFAVLNWHYSKAMPNGRLIKYGVWEDDNFIGAVVYGRGATPNLGKPYELTQWEICELVRVALTNHKTPVSQIVAETLRQLKANNPGIRLVVSFSDPSEGHKGGIYRAGNWLYTGTSGKSTFFLINGRKTHPRTIGSMGGVQNIEWVRKHVDPNAETILNPPKLRYIYPLDKQFRRKVAKLALPYPHAVEGLEVSHGDSVPEVLVQSQPTAPVPLADKPR